MRTDAILDALQDGQWHRVYEVASTLQVDETLVEKVLTFLERFDFVHFDPVRERVRIDFQLRALHRH